MKLKSIPAKFIRGGTSKGLYLNSAFLPNNQSEIDQILLKVMGSPDPTGLQMDGMGGGLSSTSKVALISKKIIENKKFLNYKFGQVSIKENRIDWSGNCGNLASGLLEFVKHEEDFQDCVEKITPNKSEEKVHKACIIENKYSDKIRVWQENKKHQMFIWGNLKTNENNKKISISGVQGFSDPIFVEFKNIVKEGAKLFPTGNLIDDIQIGGGFTKNNYIEASLMLGANPQVIIKADSLGLKGNELPKDIDYDKIKITLNQISLKAAELMKIPLTESLRISWVSKPQFYTDTSGNSVNEDSVDILSRITASNRIHHAHTGTGAINLGIACVIKGTIANLVLEENKNFKKSLSNKIRIGHPGGIMEIESDVKLNEKNNHWEVDRAGFIRTARLLMDGYVYY